MSGIALIISKNNSTIQEQHISILSKSNLKRGGNSFTSIVKDNFASICHKRYLTIYDEKSEFPFYDHISDVLINFDGRINNIQDLLLKYSIRKELPLNIILLDIYKKIGEKIFGELNGAFALIIYDFKKNKILGGRDHMGMKPIYFFENNDFLILSSTQSGIFNQPFFNKEIELERLHAYIEDFSSSNNKTFIKNIFLIPKASYLRNFNKKTNIEKYFDFDLNADLRLKNDDEYAEATFEIFNSTIKSIAQSYNNFSTKLSGGLDSSSITAMILKNKYLKNSRLKCYSIIYEDLPSSELKKSDELFYMNEVVKLGGIDHVKIPISPNRPSIIDSYKEAYNNNEVVIPTYNRDLDYEIFNSMKSNGSNIILDGFDGDSVISFGMEKFIDLVRNKKIIEFFKERKKFAITHNLKFSTRSSTKFFLKNYYPSIYSLYKKSFSKNYASLTEKHFTEMSMQELHHQTINEPSWDVALEFVEEDATNNGIEEVYPFFDRALMQYMISIPVDQKLKNGKSRYHFRNAMIGTLPSSIVTRFQKSNLSPMWIAIMKKIPKDEIYNILLDKDAPLANILDHEYSKDLIDFNLNKLKTSEAFISQKLMSLISLSIWMKKNHLIV